MAKISNAQMVVFLFLVYAASYASARSWGKTKIIQFYIHDTFTGPNATLLQIAGPSGSVTNVPFGFMAVVDDPITIGSSPTSTPLGRMKGSFTQVSLNGTYFLFSLSAVLNTSKYNGTISIFGTRDEAAAVKYLPVVGGTGDFEGVYGLSSTIAITPPGSPVGTLQYTLKLTFLP